MALPFPHSTPTLPRIAAVAPAQRDGAGRALPDLAQLRAVVTSPVTALVVMVLGLLGLFALPMVGLPFVALVVLPVVVYQLRAEQRQNLRRPRR
ncbi:hypothetical protein [Actinomycetospora termitidis]|uniref:Uncharacterized protein n=1 Tax=Actinomycetospora termitidis TaxID=3053470 RepID=A0ABT7M7Z6_9PSEU|nr:hypothetical protein [Actinomycetospora sp. Odt1-22]MDL5156796.1 hypothetical protein [Actinomycetospora sp. Odt1-22]